MLDVVRAEHRTGRLIFDDLGALFWELVNRFPTVDAAYRTRYPVVIADEHQDASALQDAVVRHLGLQQLVIFADPMQLFMDFVARALSALSDTWRTVESSAPYQQRTAGMEIRRSDNGCWGFALDWKGGRRPRTDRSLSRSRAPAFWLNVLEQDRRRSRRRRWAHSPTQPPPVSRPAVGDVDHDVVAARHGVGAPGRIRLGLRVKPAKCGLRKPSPDVGFLDD